MAPPLCIAPFERGALRPCDVYSKRAPTRRRGTNLATGTGLSYQWYQGGSALAGQTSSNLVLSSVSAADAGTYSVVISDACGNTATNIASLTVCVAPSISAAPQNLTVRVGQDAMFNVGATGTERLVYQWQFHGTNLVDARAETSSGRENRGDTS